MGVGLAGEQFGRPNMLYILKSSMIGYLGEGSTNVAFTGGIISQPGPAGG